MSTEVLYFILWVFMGTYHRECGNSATSHRKLRIYIINSFNFKRFHNIHIDEHDFMNEIILFFKCMNIRIIFYVYSDKYYY